MTSKIERATALNVSYDSQLMQDYLQSAGILVNQNPTSISAFQNSDGQTEVVVIGDDGQLYHVYREPLSDSGWSSYGLGAGFQTSAQWTEPRSGGGKRWQPVGEQRRSLGHDPGKSAQ
jgi:hypothetical protein